MMGGEGVGDAGELEGGVSIVQLEIVASWARGGEGREEREGRRFLGALYGGGG